MEYGKIIGVGNTATVFEYKEDKVLKIFNQDYPKDAIENEFNNAIAISHMAFPKPKAYEIVHCKNRIGIIYDRIEGISLQEWVISTGDVQTCAVYMAELHKLILQNKKSDLPNYKKFLETNILKAQAANSNNLYLELLDNLRDGNTLCHGDFHPGNIIISNGKPIVIDFMNLCRGDIFYDIARTVFLVGYTPVPLEFENREQILHLKRMLADLYLDQMDISREMIKNYLEVIIAARVGECPNELRINYIE